MSEVRITQLEKEMAVMQTTVPPLVAKIEKSTEAMTKLTSEISLLVQSNNTTQRIVDEIKVTVKGNENRIYALEKNDAVRKSGDQVMLWAKRTVVVGIVAALMGLVLVKSM